MEKPDKVGSFTPPYSDATTRTIADAPTNQADVERLKSEISETQADLQKTVAAIQERLSPSHLKEQATATVREATIGRVEDMMNRAGDRVSTVASSTRDTAAAATDAVRENPIPYALIGIGIAWLLANRGSSDRRYREFDYRETDYRNSDYRDSDYREVDTMETDSRNRGDYYETSGVRSATAQIGQRARVAQVRVRRQWQNLLQDNPMVIGAAALAAGALVGAALPTTEVENEYLGEARDSVVETARSLAQDTAQQLTGDNTQGQQGQQGQRTTANAGSSLDTNAPGVAPL